MAYRIEHDEQIDAAVRRVGQEQAGRALDSLRTIDASNAVESVHDCRKRCKKIRGLVRLVRPALESRYKPANRLFRDAARELSDYRDSHALLATFDDVVAASHGQLPDDGFGPLRRELAQRAGESTAALDAHAPPVVQAISLLEEGRDLIGELSLDANGWDAMAGGVDKTYGRGVDALATVIEEPTSANFHEFRKRVKYSWYHLRLIAPCAPSVLDPLTDRFHDLSDVLGDAHDLAELGSQIRNDPEAFGGQEMVRDAEVVLDGHRRLLERRGLGLAARLYVESPKRFTKRLGGYWATQQQHGDEEAAGEIADLFDADDALDDHSVDELRCLARNVDLPGRSTMRRSELVAALRSEGL